jgi:hypothetical protein
LAVVQWLHGLGVTSYFGEEHLFHTACRHGRWEVVQWLVSMGATGALTLQDLAEDAIDLACAQGNLGAAQWLFGLSGARAHLLTLDLAAPFHAACKSGSLPLVQWLVAQGVQPGGPARAFGLACRSGNVQLAQWLLGRGDFDIRVHASGAFREACQTNSIVVAQWLHRGGHVDVHAACDAAAWTALRYPPLLQWLMNLDPDEVAWPPYCWRALKHWSRPRDAWMRSVVGRECRAHTHS